MFRKTIKFVPAVALALILAVSFVSVFAMAAKPQPVDACEAQKKTSELLASSPNEAVKVALNAMSTFGLGKKGVWPSKAELVCVQRLALSIVKLDADATADGYLYDIYSDSIPNFRAAEMTLSPSERTAVDDIIKQQKKVWAESGE